MTWTLLTASDPTKPQSFRPVTTGETLYPGDILATRCVFQSDGEEVVVQGLASTMEMCDLFLYFWTRKDDLVNSGPPSILNGSFNSEMM